MKGLSNNTKKDKVKANTVDSLNWSKADSSIT